ncbi:MAG: hypothetical protein RMI91_14675 [Gemmatales bacterium]|nr:hypothetical protein [Gemmatales bacterium]MDW7995890.1 hypothetical protein [Gemmatales bacterium]
MYLATLQQTNNVWIESREFGDGNDNGDGKCPVDPIASASQPDSSLASEIMRKRAAEFNPLTRSRIELERRRDEVQRQIEALTRELNWYHGVDYHKLIQEISDLRAHQQTLGQKIETLTCEISQLEKQCAEIKEGIYSWWNPLYWIHFSQQSKLRELLNTKETRLAYLCKSYKAASDEYQSCLRRVEEMEAAADKYQRFDATQCQRQLADLQTELETLARRLEDIPIREKQVHEKLLPLLVKITELDLQIRQVESDIREAEAFQKSLSQTKDRRKKWQIHQECKLRFGQEKPLVVIAKLTAKKKRLEQKLQKLTLRAREVGESAARKIEKLILDGCNLCFERDKLIGLKALQVLVPLLAQRYQVTVVFDSSIHYWLGSQDRAQLESLKRYATVHIVPRGQRADDIILDLAGADETSFVVSNDCFVEFPDKAAVQQRRILRHEIVAGRIRIQALGVDIPYQAPRGTIGNTGNTRAGTAPSCRGNAQHLDAPHKN